MFLSIPPAFGLDISDSQFKLVALHRHRGKIFVKFFGSINVPDGYFSNGDIKKPAETAELLKKFISSLKLKSNRVMANLPDNQTYLKLIETKLTDKKEIQSYLEAQSENYFPLPTSESYLTWDKIGQTSEGAIKILVGAASNKTVDEYLNLLESAGLVPIALEVEPTAIARGLNLETKTSDVPGNPASASIILDLGANRTGLIFSRNGVIEFSVTLPHSGKHITSEIAKTLKLPSDKAEKLKLDCGIDEKKCKGALKHLMTAIFEDLAGKIKEDINYYNDTFPNTGIKQIFLTGGGSRLAGLPGQLTKMLDIETKVVDPATDFNLIKPRQLNGLPIKEAPAYTTAIGLSLKGLDS